MVIELLQNAFTGINILPTVLLILVLIYWIGIIMGALGLEFLDFDFDGDVNSGPLHAVLSFLNLDELPFMLVFSIFTLNFWIISMLMYYLPIKSGGVVNGILLIPGFFLSGIITKTVTNPMRNLFVRGGSEKERSLVMEKECTLKRALYGNRLGQAVVYRDGANIIINVKSDDPNVSFVRDEKAFVIRKDPDKNIYYIAKLEEKKNAISDSISTI